jgi:MFS family permease
VVFAFCRVVRGFVSEGAGRRADRAHPLADRGLRRILLATALIGIGFGAAEVAIPAFAIQRGNEAASGLLIAALSLGGIAGGLVLGSVPGGSTVQRRAAALIAGLAAGFCLLALAPSLAILAVLLVVAGLPLTAAIMMVTLLVDDSAPRGSAAQAIGWLATSIATGAALGAGLAGPISERAGTDPAFLLGAAAAGSAAVLTTRLRARGPARPT